MLQPLKMWLDLYGRAATRLGMGAQRWERKRGWTTTKSLHDCTPARYPNGPARFSTTLKNKPFENPLRNEPVARAPAGSDVRVCMVPGFA